MSMQTRFLPKFQALKLKGIQPHVSQTKTQKPKIGAYSATLHIKEVIREK